VQAVGARRMRRGAGIAAIAAAALLGLRAPAGAGEYEAVEVGTTGLTLKNSAVHQPKLYIKADDALTERICCLLKDMDKMLAQLRALPPEMEDSTVLTQPSDEALAGLYELALEHNPKLLQMRAELGMLAARTRQAGAKSDPSLTLMMEKLPAPIPLPQVFHRPNAQGYSVGISQMFDSYGKRGLRRRIAGKDEEIKQLAIETMELDLLWDVENMYYELLDVKAQLRSLDANIALMKLLLELARAKYSAGLTMQAEVLNGEVRLSGMEQMRTELGTLEAQLGVKLAGMLGNPPGFDPAALTLPGAYPLPPSVDLDVDALTAEALARRPDQRRVDLGVQKAELEILMAKADYHPDYELMAEYMMEPGMHDSIKASVSFPLSLHKEEKQDAKVQEMRAEGEMTRAEGAVIRNEVKTQLGYLELEMQMHSKLAAMYADALVPQARLALESAIGGYSADMMDLSDLLMAQQNLLTQETELERNYIHILHVLADLQIVSAGAFDPAPYMLATTELDSAASTVSVPPGAAPPPSRGQAAAEQAGSARDTGFVAGLGLPSDATNDDGGKDDGSKNDDVKTDSAASDVATGDDGDFYRPYTPREGGESK
jgi:outer membrane protein, heavy metal efflux system